MNLHLFCLYLNNDFNRYVIDLSNLKNENNTYPNFKNIIINENNNSLIQKEKYLLKNLIITEDKKWVDYILL